MTWIAEPVKHLLEITHIEKDGREYSSSEEFTPEERYSTDISLQLFKKDAELRVRPYTIEHLRQLVEEDYEKGVVNELVAGIRDGISIAYVGTFWTAKEDRYRRVNQYFLKNDEPSGFNFGHMSGPGWPLNQPPVLDKRLMQYFLELKNLRPDVSGSLDKCMKHLTRSGPQYTGQSDGSISFKLPKRK